MNSLRGAFEAAAVPAIALYAPAQAAQQLIPVPYPEQLGRNAQIGGYSAAPHLHQHLTPTPVPQSLGPNALGNPPNARLHGHQHLSPAPYWRQYHQWR